MTDGLAVLAAVLFAVVAVYLFRRWGWPAVVALAGAAAGILGAFWRRPRVSTPVSPSTASEASRQAREAIAEQREAGARAIREAVAKRESVAELGADELLEHVVARSEGDA